LKGLELVLTVLELVVLMLMVLVLEHVLVRSEWLLVVGHF
jgi:hypothetical protein